MRWGPLVAAGSACRPMRRGPAPLTRDTTIAEMRARVLDAGFTTENCAEEVEQALRWHPGDAELPEVHAICRFERDRRGARTAAEASIAADPCRAMGFLLLAQIMRYEDPERAAEVFATSRGETLDRAVLDDPAALAAWLRSVPPPLRR